MWAIVIVCLAIAVLTFYQMQTQGFFSTVIMAGDSMLAAFVALNYYEKLAALLFDVGLPDFGLGCITLLGLFSFTLLILRMITDRLVGGNMNFPLLVDRIGSAIFGWIASMIIVGMVMIGFQHVAVPATFFGYNRYPNLAKLEDERGLFPGPDRFVLSLLDHASSFSFSGKTAFFHHHPDLLQELYLNRIVPNNHEGSRSEAAYNALKLVDARLIDTPVHDLESGESIDVPAGETLLALRLEITSGSGKETPGASDVDGKIRFALGDFRVVGYEQDLARAVGYSRYPIGFLKPTGAIIDAVPLDVGKILTTSSRQIDLLFQWPSNVKKISPLYVEFKRTARADIPFAGKLADAQLPLDRLYDASTTATQAELRRTTISQNSFPLQKLVVVSPGRQPLEDMIIPTNAIFERAERTSDESIDEGIRHLQIEPTEYTLGDMNSERLDLYVPDGFCLVYFTVKRISSSGGGYVPPVLVDVFGNRHRSVGFSLLGALGGNDVSEFAYSSFNDQDGELESGAVVTKRFPSDIKTLRQGGVFNRLTQFYLIAQKEVPVGLLGVQFRSRGDDGTFWLPSEDIDVVLVPAL